jgi:hypothetical protein
MVLDRHARAALPLEIKSERITDPWHDHASHLRDVPATIEKFAVAKAGTPLRLDC